MKNLHNYCKIAHEEFTNNYSTVKILQQIQIVAAGSCTGQVTTFYILIPYSKS